MSSGNVLKVSVKTASGNSEDVTYECSKEWRVSDLKSHLSTHHPLKPAVFWQKLIHGGKMLPNDLKLLTLAGETDSVTLHLVISPVRSNSMPSPRQATSSPAPPMQQDPPTQQAPPTTQPTAQQRQNPQAPPIPNYYGNRNAGPHTQYNPWMQYSLNAMGGNANNNQGALPFPMAWPHPHMMAMHPYYAAQMAHWNQMGQAPGVNTEEHAANEEEIGDNPPDDDDPEQPDDMGAGGAAGGFALMANNRRRRDLVDYLYMLMMMSFLAAIGYLTGSFMHFVIFFIGVAIIQMNQAGWFALQRRRANNDNVQHEEQGNRQDNNNNDGGGDVNGDQGGNERPPPAPQEGREEQDGPAPPNNDQGVPPPTVNQRPQPGVMATVVTFIVSFFTSLFPQQVPDLQG